MPVSMDVRKKIEEDLRLIESGEQSYGSLAERYGVSKSTIFRIHIKKLKRLAEKVKEELKALEHAKKKLQTDFEALEEKYQKKNEELQQQHQQRKQKLEVEVKKLRQEKAMIKEVLEAQGLSWEEASEIVRHILNLRGEKGRLQNRVSELETEVSNWNAKTHQAQSAFLRLDDRLSNLREVLAKEEKEFHHLLDQKICAEKDLCIIRDEERKLSETVKTFKGIIFVHGLEKQKAWTQGEVKRLAGELEQLRLNIEQLRGNKEGLTEEVKRLKAESDKLQTENEKRIKKAKEHAASIIGDAEQQKKKLLAEAEQERKEIIKGADEENRRLLEENEAVRKQTGRLKAERDLVEVAIKEKLQELREARKTSEVEEAEHEDAGLLVSRLPKLPPLKSVKKRA